MEKLSGGRTSWEECLQKTSSEALSSETLWLGHELKILLRDNEGVFKNFIQLNFIQLNFNMQVFCICHFFALLILSYEGRENVQKY